MGKHRRPVIVAGVGIGGWRDQVAHFQFRHHVQAVDVGHMGLHRCVVGRQIIDEDGF
jgi:hypothetical protein